MANDDETLASPRPRFDSTQWSLVMAAKHRSTPDGAAAFRILCEKYWFPLYAFVRQRVKDSHRAKDLTQSFFAQAIEKNYVADADPSRGRFRTFLLASITNFMANEWKKEHTKKRGGGIQHLPLDFETGERWLRNEIATEQTPERLYERQWALSLLRQVLQRLREKYATAGKEELFGHLRTSLNTTEADSYAVMAERMGMTEGAVRVAAHRMRGHYREILHEEIANTLSDTSDVEDEIRKLFDTFSR